MTIDQLKAPRFLILALSLVLFNYGDAAQAQKKNPLRLQGIWFRITMLCSEYL